LNRRPV